MANIVFDSEMLRLLANFENALDELAISKINFSKKAITYKIADLTRENTRRYRDYQAKNISDLKIENIMDSYFKDLEELEKKYIKKTKDSLTQLTDSIIRMSDKKNINELESAFVVLTNELLRKTNSSKIEELNHHYAKQIELYITNCFLYTPKIEGAMSDIIIGTKKLLNNHCQSFEIELQAALKYHLATYRELVLEIIRKQLKVKDKEEPKGEKDDDKHDKLREKIAQNKKYVSANEMQFIMPTVKKFGVIIEDTFDGFTIKTVNSNKSTPLYKSDDGHFYNEDHSIEISNFGADGISVAIGDKIISEVSGTCYLGTRNNPKKIGLVMDFLEYKVLYAGIEQTDLLKKGVVFDEIAKNYPEYYNYLSNEVMFNNMRQEIEEAKKDCEELQKDDYGNIHINPNKRASFVDKVSALGFTLDEREDGIYAIDSDGEYHKIQYNSGYAYFEDKPHIGFNTNAYFATENTISGPMIDYHINGDAIRCSTDYLFMTISGSGKVCRLGFDSNDNFLCEIDIGEKVIRNNDTVKKLFKTICPKMYQRVAIACLEHEKNIKNGGYTKEQGNTQTISNSEQENKAGKEEFISDTSKLLNELDGEELTEKVSIEESPQGDIKIVDQEFDGNLSVEDEIFLLEQDPTVQRYIQLMKIKEEQQDINNGAKMNI